MVDCQNEKGGGGEEKILTLSLPPTPNRPLQLQIKHGQSDKRSQAYNVNLP